MSRLSFFCCFTSFAGTAPKQQFTQNHSKEKQKLNFCHRLKRPMVGIAQLVRALDCESKCTGSNPVIHPKKSQKYEIIIYSPCLNCTAQLISDGYK